MSPTSRTRCGWLAVILASALLAPSCTHDVMLEPDDYPAGSAPLDGGGGFGQPPRDGGFFRFKDGPMLDAACLDDAGLWRPCPDTKGPFADGGAWQDDSGRWSRDARDTSDAQDASGSAREASSAKDAGRADRDAGATWDTDSRIGGDAGDSGPPACTCAGDGTVCSCDAGSRSCPCALTDGGVCSC
jgi:hypothetical protein